MTAGSRKVHRAPSQCPQLSYRTSQPRESTIPVTSLTARGGWFSGRRAGTFPAGAGLTPCQRAYVRAPNAAVPGEDVPMETVATRSLVSVPRSAPTAMTADRRRIQGTWTTAGVGEWAARPAGRVGMGRCARLSRRPGPRGSRTPERVTAAPVQWGTPGLLVRG